MGRLIKGKGRVVTADALAARDEAAEIRAEARRQGHAEGYAAGRSAAAAELVGMLAAARAHADEVRTGARDAAVVLARKMAEKIVGRAVHLEPALMQEIAEQALAASRARAGSVVLRVHPDDLAPLQQDPPAWVGRGAALDVRVVADASVGRQGCVVETPVGRLDARLEGQLAALERALLGGRHG